MITDHHLRVLLHVLLLSLLFHHPFLYGSFSILYRLSLIIWTLHLLITWTPTWAPIPSDTPFSPLWVATAKAALFKGLLHINAARKAVVMYLMWWWQLFFRYFEFSFLSRVQRVCFNSLNIHLLRICHVQGEVPLRTFFSLSSNDEACNVDHLSHVCLLGFVSVLGLGLRPSTLLWAMTPIIAPQNFGFYLHLRRKAGFWFFKG